MILAATFPLLALATLMCLGWGWLFQRLLRAEPGTWQETAAAGMAAVVFLGGLLNLTRLAYPAALTIVMGFGFVFSILAFRSGLKISLPPVAAAVSLVIIAFTVATQLPPSIYNFHDDYQKYFAYPVRMIQTGTVFGSPLSAIGLQTLGAQSFLDGFVIAFFPISYINAVDAVFGLFLCLILAAQFAPKRSWMVAVCVLSVVVVNPQYVNISTLYCGSALIMAMVAASVEHPNPARLGLLYAALVAMKPIFAVFIALHFLAIGAAQGLRWMVRTGLASVGFVSPWVLVHLTNYLASFRIHRLPPTPVPGEVDTERLNIFSFEPLAYGSRAANYTLLVAAIALCAALCWKARPEGMKTAWCALAGIASFFVFIYVLSPLQYGYEHGLRYFTPVAIALTPAIFGLTARFSRRIWLPFVIAAVPLSAFGSSLGTRVTNAVRTHSLASYSWLVEDPDYLAYNKRVLSGQERDHVRALQEKIPAGEPILVWTNTPFYFDYRRNRIFDIDTAGIGLPWARIPAAQYLIWDYEGFGTLDEDEYRERSLNAGAGERKDSLRTLDFMRLLDSLKEQGQVLYDDGEARVVRISGWRR
jgi:hypothetical protein